MTTWDGRICADARALPIAAGSVQCCVTSPPYWGLRSYGHAGELGQERTVAEYVDAMRAVFAEVWRVLRDDGTLWLNLGDSYSNTGGMTGGTSSKDGGAKRKARMFTSGYRPLQEGLKPKDLVGIPWRVAFALQASGWYLRSDIIWHKPNPMPESVTDRPTKAHEYLFLLTKSERYYYDAEAIKTKSERAGEICGTGPKSLSRGSAAGQGVNASGNAVAGGFVISPAMSNKRTVWTVSTTPYSGAHYATFPPALIEPCILAGSKPGDVVLDPFAGTNTVGMVAEKYNRRWVAIDLGYQHLQAERLRNVQKVLV